jgi:membrane fusion protein, multidrug efflux system
MTRFVLCLCCLLSAFMFMPAPVLARESGEGASHSVRVLIVASRTARLSSQMSGQIVSLPYRLGDRFAKGDVLVGFDCERHRAQHARAQAELDRAEIALQSKKALLTLDAGSDLDVALGESEVRYARAGVMDAAALLKFCSVRAPYGGRVVAVQANQYEFVGPGESLIEIVEGGELHLEAIVPSAWVRWLDKGYRFSVRVDEMGQTVEASVVSMGARVDPVSQTIPLRAKIAEAPEGLRPGMSGSAVFQVPAP